MQQQRHETTAAHAARKASKPRYTSFAAYFHARGYEDCGQADGRQEWPQTGWQSAAETIRLSHIDTANGGA